MQIGRALRLTVTGSTHIVGRKSAAHSAVFERPAQAVTATKLAEYAALFRPTPAALNALYRPVNTGARFSMNARRPSL
jgi:hypothetical protein